MAKRSSKNSLSMLAETAEEYIKLECARRRNQPLARRRSMLQEQFQVVAPVSRLKERVAQARHHEFLVRKENRVALDAIIDSVRDLVEGLASGSGGSTTSTMSSEDRRRSSAATSAGLNPMECARLLAWAADTERVLVEFEPSDSHENDPIVRVLEQLQQLQDGPVCLAEVVLDARTLLERWDCAGVFDDQFDGDNSDSGSEDDADRSTPTNRLARPLDQSYAYQSVRQRAAANCIKRNVLRWVRATESFCQRVAEIELFGRTTESLLKELTSTSGTAAAVAAHDNPQDIFSVVRGRRVDRFANSIALADLMHFAKHVALFPVDQALRELDTMARKRRLLDLRCAIKIQSTWRKARSVFQARRMFHAMEQLRLEREKEVTALAETLALANAQTPQKSGKRKSTRPAGKKIRNSLALQLLLGASTPEPDDSRNEVKERSGSISAAMTSRVRASMMVAKRKESNAAADSKEAGGSHNGTPSGNRRRRTGGNDGDEGKHGDDEPEDTSDVVNAWQVFLDSVKSQGEEDAKKIEEEQPAATNDTDELAYRPGSREVVPGVTVTMPSMDEDDWRNWSDDEDAVFASHGFGSHSDEDRQQQIRQSRPGTREDDAPGGSSRSVSREGGSRGSSSNQIGTPRRRLTKQPTALDQRRASRAFCSVVSTADLIKRLEQRPRLDRPSVLIPFADWSAAQENATSDTNAEQPSATVEPLASTPASSSVRSSRHFHEMDFHHLYSGVEELHMIQPLVGSWLEDEEAGGVELSARLEQQPRATQALVSPSSVVPVNRVYRSGQQQQQPTRTSVVKQGITPTHEDNAAAGLVAQTPQQRVPDTRSRPRLRIYRAPASRTQGDVVVIKRTATAEIDSESIQRKLTAHAEWMQALDSHSTDEKATGPSPSMAPIPPRHAAPSKLTMQKKRRLRAQENKPLAQDRELNDGDESRGDPQTRSQRSISRAPSALPRLRSSNARGDLSLGVLAADDADPTSAATGNAPTPLVQEVRRHLRFKNREAASSSTSYRSSSSSQPARDLASDSGGSWSLGKTSSSTLPRLIEVGEDELPIQTDLDGRFGGPGVSFTRRHGTRNRKRYLPRRSTSPHASSADHNDKSVVSEVKDVNGQRVVSFCVVHDEEIEELRQHATSGGGGVHVLFAGASPKLDSTAASRPHAPISGTSVPIRPSSPSGNESTSTDTQTLQTALTTPPSSLQPTIIPRHGDLRSTFLAGPRTVRHQQAQGLEANNTTALLSGLVPQPIDGVTYAVDSPTAASDPARSAAFNKLLQQYLGLLQCSPAGVHRPHQVADP